MSLVPQSSTTVQVSRESLVPLGLPLALAMQCWPEEERAEQLEMIRKQLSAKSGGFVLLAARRGNELAGAMLAQELPGKSASIFLPQLAAGEEGSLTGESLVQEMLRILAADGIHLCQCLLAKGQTAPPSLTAAGLQHSASLLYMTCEPQFPAAPVTMPGFKLVPFQEGDETALAQLIDATYVDTQDCPALNGLRDSLDVIEGYKHVGEFRREHWLTLVEESSSRAAGCLILAAHPPHPTLELVYIGVAPEFRQRGLGAKLTRQAKWLAAQAGAERLVLAVDPANQPAIAMYSATGFWAWEERAIWVKSLV